MIAREAEQLYTFADLARLLKVGEARLRAMRESGELLGPDVIVPGGGHKAARWSAGRVREIQRGWSVQAPAVRVVRQRNGSELLVQVGRAPARSSARILGLARA